MLKKSSFQEPLGQFQPNLAGNMLGGWDSDCTNKGTGPFWGPVMCKIRKLFDKS